MGCDEDIFSLALLNMGKSYKGSFLHSWPLSVRCHFDEISSVQAIGSTKIFNFNVDME